MIEIVSAAAPVWKETLPRKADVLENVAAPWTPSAPVSVRDANVGVAEEEKLLWSRFPLISLTIVVRAFRTSTSSVEFGSPIVGSVGLITAIAQSSINSYAP